jgi:LmbE family N-acetylglucosaminyl deacetylase
VVTAIEGLGTSEDIWQAWPQLGRWPELDVTQSIAPLVVAPHPDDEVLGVGGTMALQGSVTLVAVTNGEASHPGTAVDLAAIRPLETEEALRRLHIPAVRMVRLGHPDGGIEQSTLANQLTKMLAPGQWCFATWRGDGHPDHETVGRAAAQACDRTGARLLEYPVWMWHWGTPADYRVPWHRAVRVSLPPAVARAKRDAVAAFRSQVEPLGPDAAILPPDALRRLLREWEVLLG